MDAFELRLMFVGGLLVLGAATLLASAAVSELKGWVERYRMPGTRQTSPARHRVVTGPTYGGRRS